MEVKGTGLVTTRDFVKAKFPLQFEKWQNSLPIKSRDIYTGMVMNAGWYPISDAYLTPMETICHMFYNGDAAKTGDEMGRFSAEVALTGIYKAFLIMASPNFLMKKASTMMSTYYKPCAIVTEETGPNQITLTIKQFSSINKIFEYRLSGWCKRALELSKCKNVNYRIVKQLSMGAPKTEVIFTWN
jgi:hypothetical protein